MPKYAREAASGGFSVLWKEGTIMYRNGDYVMKIPEGVCRIEDVGTIEISGIDKNKQRWGNEFYKIHAWNRGKRDYGWKNTWAGI